MTGLWPTFKASTAQILGHLPTLTTKLGPSARAIVRLCKGAGGVAVAADLSEVAMLLLSRPALAGGIGRIGMGLGLLAAVPIAWKLGKRAYEAYQTQVANPHPPTCWPYPAGMDPRSSVLAQPVQRLGC